MEAKLCAVPSLIPAERTFAVHISAPGGWGEEGWLLVLACAVPSACLHGKRGANSSTGLCTLNVKWIVFSLFFLWYNLIVVHIYLRPVNKGTPIKLTTTGTDDLSSQVKLAVNDINEVVKGFLTAAEEKERDLASKKVIKTIFSIFSDPD